MAEAKDATNSSEPSAGFKLSGESMRAYAIKRLKKKQRQGSAALSLIAPKEKP